MLTVQIEGQSNQVASFIKDLQQLSRIKVEHQENQYTEMIGIEDMKVTCHVHYCLGRNVEVILVNDQWRWSLRKEKRFLPEEILTFFVKKRANR